MSKLQYLRNSSRAASASEPPINLPSINILGTVVALVTARKERLVTSTQDNFLVIDAMLLQHRLGTGTKGHPPS